MKEVVKLRLSQEILTLGLEGERGIFHQLLPPEAEGREGRLHREISFFPGMTLDVGTSPVTAGMLY